MTTAPTLDLAAVKDRQQATWASGDFAEIATLIVPVAERLCDAADLRAGSTVLDVASGSGNAALAAARLGGVVTGIDYVPALLERGRERAAAERLDVDFRSATPKRSRSPTNRSRRRVGLRDDVRARPSARRRRARQGHAARRDDRARELDARRLHRRDVQDGCGARTAAARARLADALGHRGAPRRALRHRVAWVHAGARSRSASRPRRRSSIASPPTTGRP